MLEKLKDRYFIIAVILIIILTAITVRLFDLQIINGDEMRKKSDERTRRNVSLSGMRGKILDTNGLALAYDKKSFNVTFLRDFINKKDYEKYTSSITRVLNIIERNNGFIIPRFALRKAGDSFEFYWGNVSKETAAKREKSWRKNFYFSSKTLPKDIYLKMRERYKLPESMDDETALKVLAVWQESVLNAYASRPVLLARNVSLDTVTELEVNRLYMPGVDITESTVRTYPRGSTAAHIIGYMSRISESNYEYYCNEMKYAQDDMVGTFGIESVMERYLTGNGKNNVGKREIEVSSTGQILRELGYEPPKDGNNVMLTIDLNMQKKLEEALEQNVLLIRQEQEKRYNSNISHYKDLVDERGGKPVQFAKVGAAVVMDVKTGAVLAMASYPSYDPNMFVSGITQKQLDELFNDPAKPLFNNAISSAGTPGSIFKMSVGLAGLSEGVITVDEKIQDLGEYRKYVTNPNVKGPMCWLYRASRVTHGYVDIVDAIEHSCNYYFFTVADRLGIDKMNKWADSFGLTQLTNIELPNEVKGQIGSPRMLYNPEMDVDKQQTNLPKIVLNAIKTEINKEAKTRSILITDAHMQKAMEEFLAMVAENDITLPEISKVLQELGLPRSVIDYTTKFHVMDYLKQITWTPTDTITTGIGQDVTTVTPIAAARYISSIVNGGFVYDAHIVKRVVDNQGSIVKDFVPTVYHNLGVKQEYLDAVKLGMKSVVSGDDSDTARKYFSGFKYVDQMGGKTGTAQVSDIDIENNSWFVSFAPYDKPEIAIVVYIPNGYSGGMSAFTAKEIVQYYLDSKEVKTFENIPDINVPVN